MHVIDILCQNETEAFLLSATSQKTLPGAGSWDSQYSLQDWYPLPPLGPTSCLSVFPLTSLLSCLFWKKVEDEGFPGSPVVKTTLALQRLQVQSLVGEPRSHMPGGTAKKKKNEINT